jgi:hypothetical protein
MTIIPATVLYKERVLPSVLFYLATLTLPVSLILVALPFSEVAGFVMAGIAIPLIIGLTWLAAPLITLTESELRIGNVAIDRALLGDVEVISSANAFKERGVNLHSRAYTRFQIGVKELIKVEIKDELDPTPYWLIATRNPEVIAGLINKR